MGCLGAIAAYIGTALVLGFLVPIPYVPTIGGIVVGLIAWKAMPC